MRITENVLKIALIIALAIIVMYAINCLVTNRSNIQENFDDQYCEAAFTANDTQITIGSVINENLLSIDKNKVNDNLTFLNLSTFAKMMKKVGKNNGQKELPMIWKLDRVIVREAVGAYPQTDHPESCAVFIKTNTPAPFYLTADMGGETDSVGATPIGGAQNQVWYVLKLTPNGSGPNKTILADLHKKTIDHLNKTGHNVQAEHAGLYLITTSPKDFLSAESPFPPSRYLTMASDPRSVTSGNFNLSSEPTLNSVWIISYQHKGKAPKAKAFKPSVAIGAFPNQIDTARGKKGPYRSQYGAFMPSYVRIWNRTFWAPGAFDRVNNVSKMFQLTVHLQNPSYTSQETYSNGTVTVKIIDGVQADFSNPSKNMDVSHTIPNNPLPSDAMFDIRTIGDDMVMGEKTDAKTNTNYTIILQLLPDGVSKQKGIPDVPLIKGWIIIGDSKVKKDGTAAVFPLCAIPRAGVIQNLMGVCEGILPSMDYEQFMLKYGLGLMNAENNFNLSKNIWDASSVNPPSKDWIRYLTPDRLERYSYGNLGQSPFGLPGTTDYPNPNVIAIAETNNINTCADYAEGRKLVSDGQIIGIDPSTGQKLSKQQVAAYADRFLFELPKYDPNKLSSVGWAGSNIIRNSKCYLADKGGWTPMPKKMAKQSIGAVRRTPKMNLLEENNQKFQQIGDIGTTLTGGPDLNESFELPLVVERPSALVPSSFAREPSVIVPDMKENFETVGNLDLCASLCKQDKACREFDYDPVTKHCLLTTHSTPSVTPSSRSDMDRSYQYIGSRNQLSGDNKSSYTEFPAGTSLLKNPLEVIDKKGNKTTQGYPVNTIDDCANLCNATNNCMQFTFDSQPIGGKQTCYLQSMGNEIFDEESTYYSATKNQFIPWVDPKYSDRDASSEAEGLTPSNGRRDAKPFRVYMNKSFPTSSDPALGADSGNNTATVNECAEKCKNNQYCAVASYDPQTHFCGQYAADPDNEATLANSPSVPGNVVLLKSPPDTAILHGDNKKKYGKPQRGSTISGGVILDRNIKIDNKERIADGCAAKCSSDVRCDGMTFDIKNAMCTTYQTGDCATNPNSPTCGKITSPSDSSTEYASKANISVTRAGKNEKITTRNDGTCRGRLYCQKNWNNELPDSWGGSLCIDAIAEYEDGSEIQLDCLSRAAPKHPRTGSKLLRMKVKCAQDKQYPWGYKEPATSPLHNTDCDLSIYARILLGENKSGGIKGGVCDCDSYTKKKDWGGAKLESKMAPWQSWKGAKALFAKTYSPSTIPSITSTSGWRKTPTNRAVSETGDGPPIACYVVEDDTPFDTNSKNNARCASDKTNYQCAIL